MLESDAKYVFISHHRADKALAESFAKMLEERPLAKTHRMKVWLGEVNISDGENYVAQFSHLLLDEKICAYILFVPEESSAYLTQELQIAYDRYTRDQFKGKHFPIIPLYPSLASERPELPKLISLFNYRENVLDNKSVADDIVNNILEFTNDESRKIKLEKLSSEESSYFDRENKYLETINQMLEPSSNIKITQLVGKGGMGKTTLARAWLDFIEESHNYIAWSFVNSDSLGLFEKAFDVLRSDQVVFSTDEEKGTHLAKLLEKNNHVLVLDGLDLYLEVKSDGLSYIKDRAISYLLKTIAQRRNVVCLLTSRIEIADLNRIDSALTIVVDYLDLREANFSTISLDDNPISPQFEAEGLASVIAELIPNVKSGSETLIGIFGNWGRGKTFLMDLIWNMGEKNDHNQNHSFGSSEVVRIDFHAWKYQNTPAIWSFLYSLFLEKYIDENNQKSDSYKVPYFERFAVFRLIRTKLLKKISGLKKTVKLNIARNGWLPVLWFTLSIVLGCVWFLAVSLEDKFDIIVSLGLGGVLFLIFLYGKIPNAKKIIDDYTGDSNILDHLGTQKLIQDELKTLLNCWIKNDSAKKVLLFIDDLDRCSIDKIVDVVDAMRVMLEDTDISNRLIVFVAVDERILKLSIKDKYKNLDFDQSSAEISNNKLSADKMSHEYLDKLFLIGVRLAEIGSEDKSNYLRLLTGELCYDPNPLLFTGEAALEPQISQNSKNDKNDKVSFDNLEKFRKTHNKVDLGAGVTLTFTEQQSLMHIASFLPETTPRQLKILYFRFVLSKRLIKNSYDPSTKEHAYYLLKKIVNKTISLRIDSGSLSNSEELLEITNSPSGLNEDEVNAAVNIVTTF